MQGLRRESFREHPATDHPVYKGVMRHVGEMFDEIRASVSHYGISNCIRAALLQPLSSPVLKQVRSFHSSHMSRPTTGQARYSISHDQQHVPNFGLLQQACSEIV